MAKNKIAIDGQVKEHKHDLSDKSFRFSPDGEHWGYAVYIDDKGATVIVDGVEQKTGYNQILFNPFFSPDGKHVAYFASQYVGGDSHQYLVLDGKESQPFDDTNRDDLLHARQQKADVCRGSRRQVDPADPDDRRQGAPHRLPANMYSSNGLFFGPGGQIGYVAKVGDDKTLFY